MRPDGAQPAAPPTAICPTASTSGCHIERGRAHSGSFEEVVALKVRKTAPPLPSEGFAKPLKWKGLFRTHLEPRTAAGKPDPARQWTGPAHTAHRHMMRSLWRRRRPPQFAQLGAPAVGQHQTRSQRFDHRPGPQRPYHLQSDKQLRPSANRSFDYSRPFILANQSAPGT